MKSLKYNIFITLNVIKLNLNSLLKISLNSTNLNVLNDTYIVLYIRKVRFNS